MTDRELMTQALEALERGRPQIRGALVKQDQDAAIAALRERLAQKGEPSAEPIQPNEVLFAVEIPEGYGDVHPELLGEDVFAGKQWVRWRVVPTDEPRAEPVDLQDIEQYRMQMAGICTAALGYWKDGDSVHPDYDTPALREVAELYAKYATLAAQPKRTPLTDEEIIEHFKANVNINSLLSFADGVRYAERKHGIGDKK